MKLSVRESELEDREGDGAPSMRGGLIFSGVLHLSLLAVLIFGLPSFFKPEQMAAPISVEMVSLDELHEAQNAQPVEPAKEPEPEPAKAAAAPAASTPPPPAPQVKPTPPAPTPPQPPVTQPPVTQPEAAEPPPAPQVAVKQPEPEAVPLPEPTPEPEVAPEPEPEPLMAAEVPPVPRARPVRETPKPAEKVAEKPAVKPVEKPAEKPKPTPEPAKPTPEKKPEPQQDRLASILKNVEKLEPNRTKTPDQPKPAEAKAAAQPERASVSDRLKAAELARMIRGQMARCWRVDAGARDAEDTVIRVRVQLNPDGTVIGRPQVVDGMRMASDGYYRSAAENAMRAILECQPFELPQREYTLWRDLVLNFNPREMF